MSSLIASQAPGSYCLNQSGEETLVKVVIEDEKHLWTYGMIAHGFSITESENVTVTPSIGDNLFVYCTNSAPVQINVKGVIGYTSSEGAAYRFPKLYEQDRVSNGGKVLNVTIDETSYKAVLTSYSRNYDTTPSPVDSCSLTFLAVRV